MVADYNQACIEYDKGNYAIAFEYFYALATENDSSSQVNIANMFLHGIGTEKNVEKAYDWYRQAANNHDVEGQYVYGWYCLENKKEKEGIELLAFAGDAGYADAVYDLAGFFLHGLYSCEREPNKAMTLYEQAAFMGKKEALRGLLYTKTMQEGRMKTLLYFFKNSFALARSLRSKP